MRIRFEYLNKAEKPLLLTVGSCYWKHAQKPHREPDRNQLI